LRVLNICTSIMRNINQYLDMHLSITLSDVLHSFGEFYDSYRSLLSAHERRFYEGDGSLIQMEEEQPFQELNINDIHYHLDILEAMNIKDFDKLSALQDEALAYMREHMIEPHRVLEYFIFILNNIEGNEISKGKKHAIQFDKLATSIRLCETIDKLDEELEESFQEIETWIKDSSANKYRQEILDIIDYIEQNLDKRLTLKMIADDFEMSESSLSRTFKNETGKNLNYYINEMKMKKAMDILTNEPGMIKDVAASVGMDDQLYFNKVFKKFYQVSPSEIRKKRKSDQDE
ncbi:MAG: AraC family transcriptional regulator, partial [Longicatena sp.]